MLLYEIDEEAFKALAADLQKEYKKRDTDGKFVLEVTGAVPSKKLTEFRDNNIALQKQLDTFADVDVAKYHELVKLEGEIRSGKIKDGKTVDQIVAERVEEMKKAHDKETTKLKGELEKSNSSLSRLTITDAAITEATTLGLRGSAKDDLSARVNSMFRLKDGKPVAFNAEGAEIYGAGGEPLTMKEYVTSLVEKAPHLFESSSGTGATGGGNKGAGNGGGRPAVNPWAKETWNLTQQGQLLKQNRDLAVQMAKEKGHTIAAAAA